MAMDEKGLGKRLQAARRSAGFTQQQLCHKAGLSYSTLTKIERGAIKAPSIFTIQSIANSLGMTLDDLLGGMVTHTTSSKGMSKSGIRFVYFDLNGCLVRFGSRGFTQLAHDSAQPIDVVETVFWRYDSQVCRGDVSLDQLNTVWAERLGIMVDWKNYYLNAVDKMPGIEDLVTWTAVHYHTGILSNTMPGFITALKDRALIPTVQYDSIVDSSVVHSLKPEPEIYEVATAKAGFQPSEILLVDDNRSNLMAAENAGWRTVWFDSYQPEISIESIRAALEPAH
jgi:FMN phosphatase YigB (HAD superfamily)/DNA-binding XRE family transcriptional regulator